MKNPKNAVENFRVDLETLTAPYTQPRNIPVIKKEFIKLTEFNDMIKISQCEKYSNKAYTARADIKLLLGDNDGAIKDYEHVLKNIKDEPHTKITLYKSLALGYYLNGDSYKDKALENILKYIDTNLEIESNLKNYSVELNPKMRTYIEHDLNNNIIRSFGSNSNISNDLRADHFAKSTLNNSLSESKNTIMSIQRTKLKDNEFRSI